jgi:hypothetical protein
MVGWLKAAIRHLNAAPIVGTGPDTRTAEEILPLSTTGTLATINPSGSNATESLSE